MGPSCTSCAQVHELPQRHSSDNRGDIVFMITYLNSVNFCTTTLHKTKQYAKRVPFAYQGAWGLKCVLNG